MKPSRKRLAGLAAAVSTIAIAAPLSTAGTASAAPVFAAGWGGVVALPGFGTPLFGQSAGVIGPTIITTAPSVFVNTNNQVAAGGVWNGGQLAP
jgi:hypothetical protein